MGLKTWWENRKNKKIAKKIKKYSEKIYHINTTHETRDEIIYQLCNIQNEASTAALLNRFRLTLHENAIKDEMEKERVAKEIILRGSISVEVVKNFIRTSQDISLPFDILKELVSEDEFVKFTLEILTTEEALFDEKIIEKRLDVMKVLMCLKHGDVATKMTKLIDDDDDRVKILALNILANQENIDEIREKLLNIMVDSETPPRLVKTIIDIFCKKEWKLTGFKNKVDFIIPHDDYFINKDGIIRSRR